VRLFARSSKQKKERRDLVRCRSHYSCSSAIARQDISILDLMDELDGGLDKPREQLALEYWLWKRRQG
jgi:hypothetical protein